MLTKTVIETALDEEVAEHLGCEKHVTAAKDTAKSRNGARTKTVLTETTGSVEIEAPRNREGTFGPAIVKKRQRRPTGAGKTRWAVRRKPALNAFAFPFQRSFSGR